MEESAPSPKNPAILVVAAIGIFLAAIGSLAAYFLWPRGERVGILNLREGTPVVSVDLGAGDTLNFRLDVVVGTTSGYPDSSRSRSNAVHEQLESSEIAVALMQSGSSVVSARCGAYDGKATTVSSSSDEVDSTGLPLACKLKAEKAGKYTLEARTKWVPKDVRAAKLEVRRQRAEK